ncbi:hypothetical protein H0H81_012794, partial [Sphagnurus paluster]
MAGASDSMFMCVAVAHESPGKSFEELRIDDYIRFYSTTGRPPPPCPQDPVDDAQRARAGLPPLFKPYPERSVTAAPKPADLPAAQAFTPTQNEGEVLQSICVGPVYDGFSHEELRYYAYLAGNRTSPTPIPMIPFVAAPHAANTPTTSMPLRTGPFDAPTNGSEQMMTITTQPLYSGHSLEELRVAFMQVGRELTSAEIDARTVRSAPFAPGSSSTSTSSGATTGTGLFARPPT